MQKKIYIPISCSFYDELEALATLRKPCKIRFKDEAKLETSTISIIRDFFIRDKVEYMLLDDGSRIRLDHLIEVDGKIPDNYC